MLLSDGSMIKNDVIEAFDLAVANPENVDQNGDIDWDFVDADIHIFFGGLYGSEYLNECLNALADNYLA